MPEYIEREALTDKIKEKIAEYPVSTDMYRVTYDNFIVRGLRIALGIIQNQTTADVQEVRHGEWIEDDYGVQVCSECGEEHEWDEFRATYCDICGAKMDKE